MTQALWEAVIGENPSPEYHEGPKKPVGNVSWNDIQSFIEKLNATTRGGYRLPSESEWEYAARAGSTTVYPWGDYVTSQWANYKASDQGLKEVGSYPANAFGLYDMHGNIEEWVQDCYNVGYQGAPDDGKAWMSGRCDARMKRGGYYYSESEAIRSTYRMRNIPSNRSHTTGFRLARTL